MSIPDLRPVADYRETALPGGDMWLIALPGDLPGASSGTVQGPLSEEQADGFRLPADHEARTKYQATVFRYNDQEDTRAYRDTKEEAIAFLVQHA